jgi:hypothetical protein
MTNKSLAVIVAVMLGASVAGASRTLSGVWQFTFRSDPNDATHWQPPASECTIEQQADHLTGTCGANAVALRGAVKGDHVTLEIQSDDRAVLSGRVEKNGHVAGTWQVHGRFAKFEAVRR